MFREKKIKLLILAIFILFISIIGRTIAKYTTKIETLPKLSVEITSFDYIRVTDSGNISLMNGFGSNSMSINIVEEQTYKVNFSGITQSGLFEKANIPIYFVKPGLYQLNFTVVGNQPILYDEKYQMYGCTVSENMNIGSSNESTMIMQNGIATEGFFYKSITPQTKETVSLSFLVTNTEKPMYWVWDLSNIKDSVSTTITLTDISITRTDDTITQNAYINFPKSKVYYKYNTTSPTNEVHNTKGIYFTKATYNELLFKCEMLTGFENVCIPIKNLEPNKTYQLVFNISHSNNIGTNIGYDSGGHCYGFNVSANEITEAKNIFTNTGTDHYCFNDKGINFANSTTQNITYQFVATKETMYWIWDFSGINDDNDWVKIHINNAQLVQK